MKMCILTVAALFVAALTPNTGTVRTNDKSASRSQAICKVSPDHKIMNCTYVGKDSYGNSVY